MSAQLDNRDGLLRVAVIGVGHLGRHHARILSALEGVTLTAVVDIIPGRAAAVVAAVAQTSAQSSSKGATAVPVEAGIAAFTDARDVLGNVDAVTIAVPTESHLEVALPFLERGIAVLVEKPLARSVKEAQAVVAAAGASGTVLAVGHTERHNPAVAAALPHVTAPRFIEVHRLGAFPDRSLDIDVVFDLMIHDLDIVQALVKSDVVQLEAVGVPVLTDRVDIANARLRFASGCIANITASRISRDRVRKIRFFQPESYISIDYAAQEIEAYRLDRGPQRLPSIHGGKLPVSHEEPLKREMIDFIGAVRERRAPLVTGDDGCAAVRLAQRVADAIAAD